MAEEVWSWIGAQFGFNWGTTEKLNQIIEELGEVLSELDLIQSELISGGLDQRIRSLQNDINDIKNITAALSDIPNTTTLTNQPASPNSQALTLLSQLAAINLTNEVSDIHEALTGPDNSFDSYQSFLLSELGLDSPPRFANMPWRCYTVNGPLNDFLGYYQGYQTLAINAEAERAHASPTGATVQGSSDPNLATEVNKLVPKFREVIANQKTQSQQMVPTFPTNQVIIDLENGLMWYSTLQSPASWVEARTAADSLEVAPDPENNPDLVYSDWRLPTYAECQSLQGRGAFCGQRDTSLPSSDSTKDGVNYGLTVQGLPALGFKIADPTQIQPHGGIWVDMYAKGALYREEGTIYEADSVEFRLNDIDKDNEYKAPENGQDYENPYFLVRSIGKPLLPWLTDYDGSAPAWSVVSSDTDIPEFPPLLANYQTIVPTEAPYLGVPVGLQLAQGTDENSLTASVTYSVNLGGDYTLGSDQTTKKESVTAPEPTEFIVVDNPAVVFQAPNDTSQASIPAEVSNLAGEEGTIFWHATDQTPIPAINFAAKLFGYTEGVFPSTISASLSLANSDPVPRKLQSFLVMPQNIFNTDKALPNYQFQCTGFFDDRTVDDLTSQATWSVSGAPAGVTITSEGLLELPDTFSTADPQVSFTVTATIVSGEVTFTGSTEFATVTN